MRLRLFVLAVLLLSGTPTNASWANLRVDASERLAPGLQFSRWSAGAVPEDGSASVAVGTEKDQKLADALLARVESAGLRAIPVYGPKGYEIRAVGFRDPAAAEAAKELLVGHGIVGAEVRAFAHDMGSPDGPFVAHLLEVDPELIDVVVAHARDAAFGLETTRDLARRRGALAAINGGFFRMNGPLAGDSEGVLALDGRLLSEPDRGRSGVGFVRSDDGLRTVFDRMGFCGEVTFADGATLPIDGINRERRAGEIILFTPEFHRNTLTGPGGVEAVLRDGRIVSVHSGAGSQAIPEDASLLSFAPGAAGASRLRAGDAISIRTELVARGADPGRLWRGVDGALGAGPLLLRDGERVLRPELEAISRVFSEARHPRTAVGARADGSLLLLTVDGRRPDWSVGMTLAELTDLLLALGAVDAVNLDGGGSTATIVRGETMNRTSDPEGDRANGDAILLFAK